MTSSLISVPLTKTLDLSTEMLDKMIICSIIHLDSSSEYMGTGEIFKKNYILKGKGEYNEMVTATKRHVYFQNN